MMDKFKVNENYIFGKKGDMEINMLLYSEAKKWDQRGFFGFYFSFLKTRQLLICIFMNDNNSFIIKLSLFLFTFGICLGINTYFFDDSVIQNIYYQKGNYAIAQHIPNHIGPIMISMLIASVIKSIMFLVTFTDVIVLEIKEDNGDKKEEKINKALVKVTSKSILYFIINFVVMFICWIYVGTFCAIFKNTQKFLLINAIISFSGVLFLPFFYCLFTAALRALTLNGENKECLYKFSQFLQLI